MYLGRKQVLTAATVALLISCSTDSIKDGADAFLEDYSEKLQKLYYATAEAQWLVNTDITPEHDSLSALTEKEYAAFVGSKEVIERTRSLLSQKDELDPLQVRQLNKIMRAAAHRPRTIPAVTDELINAETKQNSLLYGFDFTLPQKDKQGSWQNSQRRFGRPSVTAESSCEGNGLQLLFQSRGCRLRNDGPRDD